MNFKSSPLPFAPDVQASVRLNYTIPLKGDIGNLVYNVSAYYTSYEYEAGGYEDLPLLREEEILGQGVAASESSPAHTLVNMRLTWNNPLGQKNLTAALFVTNLTNITVPTGSLDFLFATGVATQDFGPPRQFGIELTAKW